MIVNGIEVRDTKDVPTSFYDIEFKAWASGKHSRELEPRRQRDLQGIAGDLMNRVKL